MNDEQELVARARAGDQDAFTALYQANAGIVRAVGRKILRTDDLDDLCQEAFLLAFTRMKHFGGRAGFRTWITRIAINECLRILRKRRRGTCGRGSAVGLDFAGPNPALMSDGALGSVAARLDLEKILAGMPPLQRQMVEMAYLEGLPDAEIATALGVSLASLQSTLHKMKQKNRRR